MKTRAVIVDDEPPARSKMRKFLAARPDLELVGEAGDGEEAIALILERRPDLVFLDIQMPRGDGFDVLREIYAQYKPLVIFTTAYDEFAVRAFEVEALDYLLKPFTADRFQGAVDRALRHRERGPGEADKVAHLLHELRTAAHGVQRLLVRQEGRLFFVKTTDIEWIEAEEKYVILHGGSRKYLIRQSMAELEARLAPAAFVRIHRSYLINLEGLREMAPLAHGDYEAVMKSGARLNVGRNYREKLLRAMGGETTGEH